MSNYNVPVQVSVPVQVPIPVDNEFSDNSAIITNDMKKTYAYGRTVKILCCIDFFFSLLYATFNWYFFIPLIMSAMGWCGAKYYNMCQIFIYLCYTMVMNIARVASTIALYLDSQMSTHIHTRMYIASDILITVISFILGLWICKIIYKFYESIKNLSEEELHTLRNVRTAIIVENGY